MNLLLISALALNSVAAESSSATTTTTTAAATAYVVSATTTALCDTVCGEHARLRFGFHDTCFCDTNAKDMRKCLYKKNSKWQFTNESSYFDIYDCMTSVNIVPDTSCQLPVGILSANHQAITFCAARGDKIFDCGRKLRKEFPFKNEDFKEFDHATIELCKARQVGSLNRGSQTYASDPVAAYDYTIPSAVPVANGNYNNGHDINPAAAYGYGSPSSVVVSPPKQENSYSAPQHYGYVLPSILATATPTPCTTSEAFSHGKSIPSQLPYGSRDKPNPYTANDIQAPSNTYIQPPSRNNVQPAPGYAPIPTPTPTAEAQGGKPAIQTPCDESATSTRPPFAAPVSPNPPEVLANEVPPPLQSIVHDIRGPSQQAPGYGPAPSAHPLPTHQSDIVAAHDTASPSAYGAGPVPNASDVIEGTTAGNATPAANYTNPSEQQPHPLYGGIPGGPAENTIAANHGGKKKCVHHKKSSKQPESQAKNVGY